jgi:hypothetical protein
MKLHLLVYRGTVRHSDIKERLGEVCVLRHRVRNFLKFTPYFFAGGGGGRGNLGSRRPNVPRHLDTGSIAQRAQ